MPHLDTAYKLGSLAAVNDFTAWLQNDDGNPTEYPKRRGSILKTAQGNPMQPNPNMQQPPAQPLPSGGTGGMVGGPQQNTGASPVTPPPAVKGAAFKLGEPIIGGGTRQAKDLAREGVFGVGSPPPKPVTPPPKQPVKTSADRAVEQVMRKLGKSMSRRPISRDGTKYEAIKKKLRKQKPKKD